MATDYSRPSLMMLSTSQCLRLRMTEVLLQPLFRIMPFPLLASPAPPHFITSSSTRSHPFLGMRQRVFSSNEGHYVQDHRA